MVALIFEGAGENGTGGNAPDTPLIVGGLSLTDRAVLAAHRAGIDRIVVIGSGDVRGPSGAWRRARGADVTAADWSALQDLDLSDGVLIVGSQVLVEPRALSLLLERWRTDDAGAILVAGGGDNRPALAVVPSGRATGLAGAASETDVMNRLTRMEPRREVSVAPLFCRRLDAADDIAQAEADYIRHQNGRESFFTKKIRRFSIPLSRVLVRHGVRPNQVTVMGLLLAVGAAMAVSVDVYVASLAGALLYYASMVFDCSDGEVARLTFRDSRFGAWLETVVDYVTYFLLLGGLVLGSQRRAGAEFYLDAALVALIGSIVVVAVAGYLRQRVAGGDPGQFDDASAAVLRTTRFHRFARWGRQWIKRSTIAHLIVALAIVDQLPILIELWAFGAVVASVVIVSVEPFIVRRVVVPEARS